MADIVYKVELDEVKGRVLVAQRAIEKGELILREQPLGK